MNIAMELVRNGETIISFICGIGSVVMFLLSKKQKEECQRINNMIDQKIEILTENKSITSKDKFDIGHVGTFDNRKNIK